jgi:hypothetical protein
LPQLRPGTRIADEIHVLNSFMAGQEMVCCELTAEHGGACRLTVHHSHGTIVEYFRNVHDALARQQQLEDLLMAARGAR